MSRSSFEQGVIAQRARNHQRRLALNLPAVASWLQDCLWWLTGTSDNMQIIKAIKLYLTNNVSNFALVPDKIVNRRIRKMWNNTKSTLTKPAKKKGVGIDAPDFLCCSTSCESFCWQFDTLLVKYSWP